MVLKKLVSSEKINASKYINQDEPQLRFKDFSECWDTKKLDSLLDVCYGKDYKHLNEGNFPVLGTGGVMCYVEEYLYSGESILIGRKGTIDKPRYINGPFWTVDTLFYTKIKEGNPKFIFYQLNKINWLKYNEASGVPSLSANNIKNIKIKIPSVEEQKKIASFLSAVDKKIELLEKKIDYSKELKNYFLNSLIFEQFSDNFKHFRFEEFEDNWIYKSLEKVSVVKDGTHDSPKYHSEGFPLITSKNLLNNATLDMENVNFISKEDFDKINKRSKVDCGDILFGMIGTIGNPVLVKEEGFAIKNVALIKEKEDLKNDFLIHVLNSNIIKKQFYKLNAGGTQKFIALNLIRNLKVPIPSINEQNQISNFLNLFDKKTYLYSKELENMNNFKKGLLQKMFV